MNFSKIKGTPFDYSDEKYTVYFEVANKESTKLALENLNFIDKIKELNYGFELVIAIQQIPEVVRYLANKNIAIYAVIPNKNNANLQN